MTKCHNIMYFEKTTKPFIDIKGGNFLIKIAKAGVLPYIENGEVIYKHKPKEELFSEETLEKAINIPITVDHPNGKLVSIENRGWLQVGVASNIREGEGELAGYLIGDATITDEKTLNEILNHTLTEVSVGTIMDEVDEAGAYEGKGYSKVMRNIEINHIALLGENEGRGGSDLKVVLDKKDKLKSSESKKEAQEYAKKNDKIENKEKKENKMIEVKINDSKTIEVDEETAGVINSLKDELSSLQKKISNDKKDNEISRLTTELENAKKEVEEIKQKNKAKNDSKQIMKDRSDASKILGIPIEQFAGKDINEIKKEVIKKIGLDSKESDTQEILDANFNASKIIFSNLNRNKDGAKGVSNDSKEQNLYQHYGKGVRL